MISTRIECSSFRVAGTADGRVVLEIEDAAPADLLPRLIPLQEAAQRLGCCARHVVNQALKHGIRRVAALPVRFREADLLRLAELEPAPSPKLRVLPKSNAAAPCEPSRETPPPPVAAPAAPRRKVHLEV